MRRKRQYQSGAATAFMTRKKAMQKLQLGLVNFRRLCILKGIYPVEPSNKKQAGKGNRAPKTYYVTKDIAFLLHEPVLQKFRETKIFMRRLKCAKERREQGDVDKLLQNRPEYALDHIVKERYPSFIDAVRDLDDCLSMTHLFSTFPKTKWTRRPVIDQCRRLTVEFQHYVIASHSLKKVFISIKGIYYQAEVKGQTVTWLTPHQRSFEHPGDIDYKIMSTFVEFYTTMLGFINFKLYSDLGLYYPPKLMIPRMPTDEDDEEQEYKMSELIEALNTSLQSITAAEEIAQLDSFPTPQEDEPDAFAKARLRAEEEEKFSRLFKNMKFFLNREVPHESLTFIIRSFGGEVSWDHTAGPGATYQCDDETITHHVIDRPQLDQQYMSRYYLQPQWVFDCVNFRRLIPVNEYLPGATLPPHLSPFVEEEEGDYVPPDKKKFLDVASEDVEEAMDVDIKPAKKAKRKSGKRSTEPKKALMKVQEGKVAHEDVQDSVRRKENEERKLAEIMIPRKKKHLYTTIMKAKKQKAQEVRKLTEKRKSYEKEKKEQKRQHKD